MKYMITKTELMSVAYENMHITSDDENFVTFPAAIGNPNYDAFLVQAKLTDKQVKALKPDTWYDFPEGE